MKRESLHASQPTDSDYEEAEKIWRKKHPYDDWELVRTRTKTRLVHAQKYLREYQELSSTLKGTKK